MVMERDGSCASTEAGADHDCFSIISLFKAIVGPDSFASTYLSREDYVSWVVVDMSSSPSVPDSSLSMNRKDQGNYPKIRKRVMAKPLCHLRWWRLLHVFDLF